ncbi:MAG: ABC transporter permease [Nitrospiria bacterium]
MTPFIRKYPSRAGFLSKVSPGGWILSVFLIVLVVMVPLGVVLSSFFTSNQEVWQHLSETVLVEVLLNTLWLSVGVVIGTGFLGISLAWLSATTVFPGRAFFDWALMLPMAIPTYVTAFVTIGLLDFTGVVQTTLRAWSGGNDFWFPQIRSTGGVILVMTLTLYPYVYLLSRNAFLTQGRRALEVAQSLGQGPWHGFFRVALPMARPWIIGGLALALMETLADFGAVSIFNYDTFATAIYKAWFGFFSLEAASQLASLLVILIFLLLLCEQWLTARIRYTRVEKAGGSTDRVVLNPLQKWFAFAYALGIFSVAFVIPVVQLIFWSVQIIQNDLNARYFEFLTHSFFLGIMAASITVGTVLILVYANRLHNTPMIRLLVKASTLGYALPGSVLAVGIFIPLAWLDNQVNTTFNTEIILKGTLASMLLSYLVRFLGVAHQPVQSAIQRISQNIDESARNLGCSGLEMLRRIHFPMLRGGLVTGFVLVFVDVMKEMPITLMTRPFGWDTLSIRIYEMTSEGEWERAALPAVVLIFIGLVPIMFLMKGSDEGF